MCVCVFVREMERQSETDRQTQERGDVHKTKRHKREREREIRTVSDLPRPRVSCDYDRASLLLVLLPVLGNSLLFPNFTHFYPFHFSAIVLQYRP